MVGAIERIAALLAAPPTPSAGDALVRWVEELRGRIARGDILATMYATGEGVKKDVERARSLFDEAEANGVDVSGLRSSVGL